MEQMKLEGYENLLLKDQLTGEELGKLEIANLLTGLKNTTAEGGEDPIPELEIRKLIERLPNKKEEEIYDAYIDIYMLVMRYYNIAVSQDKRSILHMSRLIDRLSIFSIKESLNIFQSELPVIMTEEQYNRVMSESTSAEGVLSDLTGSENGVCVLKHIGSETPINEKGEYIPPAPMELGLVRPDLEDYLEEDYKRTVLIDVLSLQESLYFVHGYNAFLDLISEVYEIPEFKYAQQAKNYADLNIGTYNQTVQILKRIISDRRYRDPERKEIRLKALNESFPVINESAMIVYEEKIREAKERMLKPTFYTAELQEIINFLCRKGDLHLNDEYT